jgi:predicted permease
VHDIRYALRVLLKSPGFTAAVVVSLALGIGANTAIFTLIDAVMWRLLPIRQPESLFVVGRQSNDGSIGGGYTYGQYRLLRDNSGQAELAGYTTAPINVSVDGPPEPSVQGQLVSGNYFALLGVAPEIGRVIGPDDDRLPNGHPVAMLSYGYWERRFARDPSVIGRTVRLSAAPFTIIGVTPAEFFGVEIGIAPDLFLPIMMQPTVMPAFENLLDNPIVSRTWVQTIARTKPGVTPEQAAAALEAMMQAEQDRQAGGPPPKEAPPRPRLVLAPATAVSALRQQFSRPLFILLAMVGLVLLTACANTANLLLARAAARRPEFAVRLALGAGRHRLMRQLVVESVVLALVGGVCGVLLAGWATQLLVASMSSGRTPIELDLSPNVRVLAFTAAVSMVTGLLFGLAPAWRSTRNDLIAAVNNLRGSVTRDLRPARMLTIVQLALSLLLLIGAGVFVRSLQNLNGESVGRDRILMLRVEPKGSDQRGITGTSERLDQTYKELIRRVREIRGVQLASMANMTPTVPTSSAGIALPLPSGERTRVPLLMVYPSYFATIGIPIVRGRDFVEGDLGPLSPAICIVNESFVRQFFPGEDPIGKPCYTGRRPRLQGIPPVESAAFQIVAIVQDSRYSNPRGEIRPAIFLPFLQTNTGRGQMVLHVRVAGNQGEVLQRIREEVAAVDPAMPMFDVHTLEEEMDAALVQQRLIAMLSTLFGTLALVLACVGLYGLLAFGMVQRTTEIGIRLALGARRADVVWLVVSEALLLVVIGMAIGVPAALAATRFASSQISGLVFGLKATDPWTIALAALALVAVAIPAAYLPARRAARVDPMVVLRRE